MEQGWPCDGPLLRLAVDVAERLLPGLKSSIFHIKILPLFLLCHSKDMYRIAILETVKARPGNNGQHTHINPPTPSETVFELFRQSSDV